MIPLHVAVIGLGSMGKRRIRAMRRLGVRRISAWDPREDRREAARRRYDVVTTPTAVALLAESPDALVISTPPDLHTRYALLAARAGIPFFTEASVVDDYDPLLPLLRREPRLVAAPSCTLRFHPHVEWMAGHFRDRRVRQGSVFFHHCGQYLPDWHPHEDYRRFYVARGATGAAREMVTFEIVWLTALFGPVAWVSAERARRTSLEIEGPDLFLVQVGFRDGTLGQMQIDLIARSAYRDLRVVHEHGGVEWSLHGESLRVLRPPRAWRGVRVRPPRAHSDLSLLEWTYVREIAAFLDAVRGRRRYPYSFEEDRRILQVLAAIERSASVGRRVRP